MVKVYLIFNIKTKNSKFTVDHYNHCIPDGTELLLHYMLKMDAVFSYWLNAD